MLIEEYNKLVNPDIVSNIDYGKWINFQESYPPLQEQPFVGTLVEILHKGNPYFHSFFHNGKEAFIRDYNWYIELLYYNDHEYINDYWRFVPSPPGNEGYDVG